MKRILSLFLIIVTAFSLSACGSDKNDQDILRFFNALDHTLQAKSAQIDGTVTIVSDDNTSKFHLTGQFNQEEQLACALQLGLEANGNKENDYLDFYIKDGKTYLKNLDTKTQSIASNIGITNDTKISAYNPFLNFTDDELVSLFSSTSRDGDSYTFELDASKLSELLDDLGSVQLSNAEVQTTFRKKVISHLSMEAKGTQNISSETTDIEFQIDLNISHFNQMDSIDFPDDLDTYTTSE